MSTDTSERKRAEEALRAGRERLVEAQKMAGVGSIQFHSESSPAASRPGASVLRAMSGRYVIAH
jgi:C4-dicarboxylate-specific signal transduction histidine kinase